METPQLRKPLTQELLGAIIAVRNEPYFSREVPMKTVGKWIGIVFLNIFALAVLLMPWGGLLFLLAAVVSGGIFFFNAFGIGIQGLTEFSITFFQYGWKVYIGMAFFTLLVMTTFTYQHCCMGKGDTEKN